MAISLLASNKSRSSLSWLLQLAQLNRAEFDAALKRYLYPRAPRYALQGIGIDQAIRQSHSFLRDRRHWCDSIHSRSDVDPIFHRGHRRW